MSIGFQGQLRNQPVAQVLFHPMQVNPVTRMLRVYQWLRVRVEFGRPLNPADNGEASIQVLSVKGVDDNGHDPFAGLMRRSLINADQAGR